MSTELSVSNERKVGINPINSMSTKLLASEGRQPIKSMLLSQAQIKSSNNLQAKPESQTRRLTTYSSVANSAHD